MDDQDWPKISHHERVRVVGMPSAKSSTRKRAVLSAENACEIFLLNPELCSPSEECPGSSTFIARYYGISPKAVRDIWNRYVTHQIPN